MNRLRDAAACFFIYGVSVGVKVCVPVTVTVTVGVMVNVGVSVDVDVSVAVGVVVATIRIGRLAMGVARLEEMLISPLWPEAIKMTP